MFNNMSKKIKLGLAVSHLRLRLDIRNMVEVLAEKTELHVFASKTDLDFIDCECFKYDVADIELNASTRVLTRLYDLFKEMPLHPEPYIDYVERGLERRGLGLKKSLGMAKVKMRDKVSFKFKYDNFLNRIGNQSDLIEGLDVFIGVTDVVSDQLYSNVLKAEIPFYVYVTSWDHPPKFTRFLKHGVKYLVWGEGMREDLIDLHGINEDNIKVVGSSQFSNLHEYLATENYEKPEKTSKYIYYIATFGYPLILNQELSVIRKLSEILYSVDPLVKILFRPYPLLGDQGEYDELSALKNIVFDAFDPQSKKVFFNEDDILHKYDRIQNAEAVFHMGTTMGLEAAFFDVPVYCFSGDQFDDVSGNVPQGSVLSKSFNQWHLQKYFMIPDYKNVIISFAELATAVDDIVAGNTDLKYNTKIRSWLNLKSSEEFIGDLLLLTTTNTKL
jgi:hypothetical protein